MIFAENRCTLFPIMRWRPDHYMIRRRAPARQVPRSGN
jgi:hypothetical protein